MMVVISLQGSVSAITNEQRAVIKTTGYFDLEPTTLCETPGTNSQIGNELFVLGDSLTLGMAHFGDLMTKLETAGFIVDTRKTADVPENQVGSNGLINENEEFKPTVRNDTLEATGGATARYSAGKLDIHTDYIRSRAGSMTFLIALGTNPEDDLAETGRDLVVKIRSLNPTASILWLNTYFEPNTGKYLEVNQTIATLASENNFSVIDIASATPDQIAAPDGGDDIHFNGSTYGLRATWLADQLRSLRGSAISGFTDSSGSSEPGSDTIDPRWINLWTTIGQEFGIDPALLAGIFTAEHNGKFYPLEGDRPVDNPTYWARPNGTRGADDTQAAAGPFQILGSTWDDLTRQMGVDWPRSARDDPERATRAAAQYLKNIGGVPGLEPGGGNQPQGFKPGRSEVPYTAASIGARYNQGPAWHDQRPIEGDNPVFEYAEITARTYERVRGTFGSISGIARQDCQNPEGFTAGVNGWGLPGEPNAMIYYSQLREASSPRDPAVTSYWGDYPYGSGTIAGCGCGPTSFAMVVATLRNDLSVTPANVAEWAANNGYRSGTAACAGSAWWWIGVPEKTRERWGVISRRITIDEARGELAKGNLIIASVGKGSPFLSEGGRGHILVMRGFTDDGKFLFADPSDGITKRQNGGDGGQDVPSDIFQEAGASHTPVDASIVSQGLNGLFVVEAVE